MSGFYEPGDDSGHVQADLRIAVTPSPKMPETMAAGHIDGFTVGEPWNTVTLSQGLDVQVVTDEQVVARRPGKVFGLSAGFVEENPNTTRALVRALIRAGMWLDGQDNGNRPAAVEILAAPADVNCPAEIIGPAMFGTFQYELGDTREMPDFNIFVRGHASYPFYLEAVWTLTQMRRWCQIPQGQTDEWYHETAARVFRPDIYMDAAQSLIEDDIAVESDFPYTDGYRPAT
jgi:nitrate/nitrite transport system substrate-binding protein